MVGWYDPGQLLSTGINVAVSEALGTRADFRVMEAAGAGPSTPATYPGGQDGLWIDYVADLGDGWNPTYAVATQVARDLTFDGPGGRHLTRRGGVVVMGGDEVYPVASREAYAARTEQPYRAAFAGVPEAARPELFALPGNHDWYDGLAAFSRTMCQGRRFGGLRTRQERSYFALRLPAGWWLLGLDFQLESDVDRPQVEFFRAIAAQMKPEDNVILCIPEPSWIYRALEAGPSSGEELEANLAFLERELARVSRGARVRLRLAGDLHHYRHHRATQGYEVHDVVAGGGGAFLHPTHAGRVQEFTEPWSGRTYAQVDDEYPRAEVSRRLAWWNLAFPALNPRFGLLTAAVYLALSWILPHDFGGFALHPHNALGVLSAGLAALARAPWPLPVLVALLVGLIAFADGRKPAFRYLAGPFHALTHLLGATLAAWLADRITVLAEFDRFSAGGFLLEVAITGLTGYVLGAVLFGLYLLASIQLFGCHPNEAFSSLRIQDWKNFVRLHVAPNGTLTVYAIGLERVPRRWRRSRAEGPAWEPDGEPVTSSLIDRFEIRPGDDEPAQSTAKGP